VHWQVSVEMIFLSLLLHFFTMEEGAVENLGNW
jgi:hypothetical protein